MDSNTNGAVGGRGGGVFVEDRVKEAPGEEAVGGVEEREPRGVLNASPPPTSPIAAAEEEMRAAKAAAATAAAFAAAAAEVAEVAAATAAAATAPAAEERAKGGMKEVPEEGKVATEGGWESGADNTAGDGG